MLLVLLTVAALAQPLPLGLALEEALQHNLELQQQRMRLEQSEAALLGARGLLDPTVRASVNTRESSQPSNTAVDGTHQLVTRSAGWSAGLDQRLPTGGSVGLTWSESFDSSNSANVIRASTTWDRLALSVNQPLLSGFGAPLRSMQGARLAVSEAELALRATTEQLVLDASAAYWRLVSARETHALAVRSREIAEQSLADIQERYDEGFAGSGDVLQVERLVGTARQAEVVALAEVEAADMALRRVLGRPVTPGAVLDPIDAPVVPEESPGFDEVLELARAGNARWLRDRLAVERAELGVRQARNSALPDLSVTGAIGYTGLGESPGDARQQLMERAYSDWTVGASLSVPLPGRALLAELRSARLERSLAQLALEAAEQDLVLRVQAAVRAVERDRLRVQLAADTVRVAQLALEADQERLREGKGSTRDVVISLEALDQAQAASLLAEIDLQASLLELRRVAGTLLE